MKITNELTDESILAEIGVRLAKQRLSLLKSQAELAEECGISRRTIQHAEAGRSIQTESLIRLLRSLGLLDALDTLLPAPGTRPMDVLKLRNRERKRAVKKRSYGQPQTAEPWQWGDEE